MSKYSISEFIKQTEQVDRGEGFFELETPRMLEVNLDNLVWAKAGSMVAYNGQIKFEREGILEHGLGSLFKKALTGEGASLMKATGKGKLYLADSGKKIIILHLQNEAIYVNGNDLLAFEPTIKHEIKLMRKVAGMMAGGLFNIRCEGTGLVAITTHYEPLTLRVTPGNPIITDPNATVAWSGNLQPEFQTDISFKTFLGRGSGESFQMRFEGDGFVIVQPYEEVYMQAQS
ncbi:MULTISPECIES: AIM24 family protein [Bacillales]|uniref:AIM24 family protein n=1 Tax=Lysinibacillus louembei TaxID=1470088 RepID=A0ABZ0RXY7_9BACI|nr:MULTISPECIES: AIM24 family protein [Bacillales]MCT6923191.1 AIM24 family protein [Metasolibacillus sp.]MCT6939504.1 AIM24 family protein [Metasolibacillus sp.]WPK11688.1 AIM24 family protein [Lysinibacillus louembei]